MNVVSYKMSLSSDMTCSMQISNLAILCQCECLQTLSFPTSIVGIVFFTSFGWVGQSHQAGWSSGKHSGLSHWRPGFDSRSGRFVGKVWEYLRWFFISRLQPSKPDTGVYKRDWWGRANYLCSHCFLWPGTIKSWWKPSPGQTDQLHTLQHSPHTCIHKWREGIKRVMHSAPKKKNSRGYEACSKKDGLVESSVTDCWSMSPSNVTSNTASKSNWRWPGARTGRTGTGRVLLRKRDLTLSLTTSLSPW